MNADELAMLRSSVRQAVATGDPTAASTWARVRAVGWEHAFASSPRGVGAAEAVAVAEECGRHAVGLPVPALVVGLFAATQQREATADDAVPLWTAVLPSNYWQSPRVRGEAAGGIDVVVPGFDLATHVVVTTHDPGRERVLFCRASDLTPSARAVESLDAAVPIRLVRIEDATLASADARDLSEGRLDLWRDLSILVASAQAIGLLDRALAASVAYACDRTAFGRPIGSFQAVKHMLADAKVALECSRAMVADAVRRIDDRDASAPFATAGAARFVGRHVLDGLQLCVQVHGGIGITMESELHVLVRRATTLRFLHLEPFATGRRILDLQVSQEGSRV